MANTNASARARPAPRRAAGGGRPGRTAPSSRTRRRAARAAAGASLAPATDQLDRVAGGAVGPPQGGPQVEARPPGGADVRRLGRSGATSAQLGDQRPQLGQLLGGPRREVLAAAAAPRCWRRPGRASGSVRRRPRRVAGGRVAPALGRRARRRRRAGRRRPAVAARAGVRRRRARSGRPGRRRRRQARGTPGRRPGRTPRCRSRPASSVTRASQYSSSTVAGAARRSRPRRSAGALRGHRHAGGVEQLAEAPSPRPVGQRRRRSVDAHPSATQADAALARQVEVLAVLQHRAERLLGARRRRAGRAPSSVERRDPVDRLGDARAASARRASAAARRRPPTCSASVVEARRHAAADDRHRPVERRGSRSSGRGSAA